MTDLNLFVGMISGTSRDGVDTALVRFNDNRPDLLHSLCLPYPADLETELAKLIGPARRPPEEALHDLDGQLAEFFSMATLTLLEQAGFAPTQIRAIGSHGQTVWHDPEGDSPETIQLGDPALIARLTGITTVGNFRQADLEAGGQGAPLAPLLHRALFRPDDGSRAVVNLGGIANVSFVDANGDVSGYDTGPANCLMDGWIQKHQGLDFDGDGKWAASGHINAALLKHMLSDEFFSHPPPKSTGVEYFNAHWLERAFDAVSSARSLPARDVQATLCELTATSLAGAITEVNSGALAPSAPGETPAEILLCGGGAHNAHLRQRIQALSGLPVKSTEAFGLHPDWVEAVLFAWLARERLAGNPQDTTRITGADRPVLLGDVHEPPYNQVP